MSTFLIEGALFFTIYKATLGSIENFHRFLMLDIICYKLYIINKNNFNEINFKKLIS